VRSIIACATTLLVAATVGASAQAAAGPDISHYMIVIVSSTTSTTNGVQMTVLTFPSKQSCEAAAAVFIQPVEGARVVARCAPQK
jgi:hypothetical protein